jgi:thiol-disulfide isomerase/thioredoxin
MKQVSLLFCSLFFLTMFSCSEDTITPDTSSNSLRDLNGLADYESTIKTGTTLVFFHATWCSICKAQRPAVDALIANPSFSKVKFIQVDKDLNKPISDKFKVQGQPNILIYKDNVEKHRLVGGGHPQDHIASLLNGL